MHSSTQYAEVPASASLNNWTYQTVSLWINSPASSMPAYGRVLEKSADNEWGIIFNDGTIDNKIAITDSAVNRVLHSAIPLADGTWHKLDVQWTSGASGAISLYVDGVLDSSTTGNNNVIKTGNVEFGRLSGTPGYEYNGKMDEVQISNNIRSAYWIATSYKNQFAPNTFESRNQPRRH